MPPPRTLTRRACDSCRVRKIKCNSLNTARTSSPPPLNLHPCQACLDASLPCTFQLPVRRCGPPAKRRDFTMGLPPSLEYQSDDHELQHSIRDSLPSTGHSRGPLSLSSPSDIDDHRSSSTREDGSGIPDQHYHQRDCPSIDSFCPRANVDELVHEFLEKLYPLFPVVHIPTFLADLHHQRHLHDSSFLSLLVSILAVVVAVLPSKFRTCKQLDASFRYTSRLEMIESAQLFILSFRKADYYDSLNLNKWATAYLLAMAYGYLNYLQRSTIYFSEGTSILREMKIHQAGSYEKLNNVEQQLRKKAFWLNFTISSHLELHNMKEDSVYSQLAHVNADAEKLIPLAVDDEFITEDKIFPQPPNRLPLVAGLNALTIINQCFVNVFQDSVVQTFCCCHPSGISGVRVSLCTCGHKIRMTAPLVLAHERLRQVERCLDNLPAELCLRQTEDISGLENPCSALLQSQYEIMQANIHITHLWVQSLLIERIVMLSNGPSEASDLCISKAAASTLRENLCHQLFTILSSISTFLPGLTFFHQLRPFIIGVERLLGA